MVSLTFLKVLQVYLEETLFCPSVMRKVTSVWLHAGGKLQRGFDSGTQPVD